MDNLLLRLESFEKKLEMFSQDIVVLQQLYHLNDPQAQLNKIRYIAEGILQILCKKHNISWGKGEPTLERMVGPLRAEDILTASIASHFRSIQSTASPGSHYQENKLTITHVQIATLALIEILDWYILEFPSSSIPTVDTTSANKRPYQMYIAIFCLILCLGFGYRQLTKVSSNHPMLQETRARETLLEFQKHFSERHYIMMKLTNQWRNDKNIDYSLIKQNEDFQTYRNLLNSYNIARGIYRLQIENIFGEEMYLWEREIHIELLYAGKNLECVVNQQGVVSEQLRQAQEHLSNANDINRNFVKTIEQILQNTIAWPLPVQHKKSALEPQLENPC